MFSILTSANPHLSLIPPKFTKTPSHHTSLPRIPLNHTFIFAPCAPQACKVTSVASDSLRPRGLAHQAPRSMGFSRPESCSVLPSPPPGDLPDPGIEPASLASPVVAAWVLCHQRHLGSSCEAVFVVNKRKTKTGRSSCLLTSSVCPRSALYRLPL